MSAQPIPISDQQLTPRQVCSLLGISQKTLQRMLRQKPPAISYVRLSARLFRFRRAAVEAFIAQRTIKGAT
jgi:excisionase family DNA binding protein